MAIAWSNACQSNGNPGTYYEYQAESWNRRVDKVHVRLKLRLRMQYKGSYFSFAIGHECKVNGVYQKTNIKMDRTFWGGWSTYGWEPYGSRKSEMLNGTDWHGWYTVFDGDVPVGVDDTSVTIIPCITRPCICRGGAEPYQLNELEKCNWQGSKGVWHPWGETEYVGYWRNSGCTQDGCFLNNRNKEPLSGGLRIEKYPRIASATQVTLTPYEMDVAQTFGVAETTWRNPDGAVGTNLDIYRIRNMNPIFCKTIRVPMPQKAYKFTPHVLFNEQAGLIGDRYYIRVTPYDKNNVPAASYAYPLSYATDSEMPYFLYSASGSGYVMDAAYNPPVSGANVAIWTYNGGANQQFTLERGEDGYYVLRNAANPELVLDASGRQPTAGANVSVWTYNGGLNQKWLLYSPADDVYVFKSAANTALALDVEGSSPAKGANICLHAYRSGKQTQQWRLVEADGILSQGHITYVGHKNPNPVLAVNIDRTRIDVAYQDTVMINASWQKPAPARNQPVVTPVNGYNVYVGKVLDDESIEYYEADYVQGETAIVDIKRAYGAEEIFDGERFVIGIQSADEYGAVSAIVPSAVIEYYEVKSIAPTQAYIVGVHGDPNYVLFKGEDCAIYYYGNRNGSYPIAKYVMYRLSDGATVEWESASRTEHHSDDGLTWKVADRYVPGTPRPNVYEVWELRAYNTKNRPVYSDNDSNTWTRITVYYYGGLIYVYDGSNQMWRDGICYVYDEENGIWHEAELLHVYSNGDWRSL